MYKALAELYKKSPLFMEYIYLLLKITNYETI